MVCKKIIPSLFFMAVFCCTVLASAEENPTESTPVPGLDGITKPVSDIDLSFVQPGKIKEILVREGQVVQAGDVLISQEDEIEQIQRKILTARSKNLVPVQLAEVELRQKKKDLVKLQGAYDKGATNRWEVDHASLAADTALLAVKIREFDRNQNLLELESLTQAIENLTITSPINGRVEVINIETGETVQALSPVIRIVKTDPLLIDLPVPVDQAVQLAGGQTALVTFIDTTEMEAEVVKISSVADAAATTLEVQLQLTNSKNRPAGERVKVVFAE